MIRVKGTINKGRLMLSEPIQLKEGTEFDIIAYVERTTGESLDKKARIVEVGSDSDSGNGTSSVSIGSTGTFITCDSNNSSITGSSIKKEIAKEEGLQYKIKQMMDLIDITTLITLVKEEHPQLSAILIGMMERDRAKVILENLDPSLQGDLIYRLAKQQKVSFDVLNAIYEELTKKFSNEGKEIGNLSGGMESAVELLSIINDSAENNVVDYISSIDKDFGDHVKKQR